jgi:hypothetical protein
MNAELITRIAQSSSSEPLAQGNESARTSIYPPGYCCMNGKKHDSADPRQKHFGGLTLVCPMTCVRVRFQELN